MGTRNLTIVVQNNEPKIAQYGQWDGYPDGVGVGILSFLKEDGNLDKLKANLSKCRFLDEKGIDKDFIESYEKNTPNWSNEPDNRTPEQKEWWSTYMTRDLADEILTNVANSNLDEIILGNRYEFAVNSLSCEWAYVIDLDKNTFEVYEGYNQSPLSETERFFPLGQYDEYYPVKLAKSFDISSLPERDEFIACFQNEEQED